MARKYVAGTLITTDRANGVSSHPGINWEIEKQSVERDWYGNPVVDRWTEVVELPPDMPIVITSVEHQPRQAWRWCYADFTVTLHALAGGSPIFVTGLPPSVLIGSAHIIGSVT
jgi:hypothetical protein